MRFRRRGRAALDARPQQVVQAGLRDLLIHLEALGLLHRTLHWRAKGPNFFQQHLLFERLYAPIPKEVDSVAEHFLGLELPGATEMTNALAAERLAKAVTTVLADWDGAISFVARALFAERAVLGRLRQLHDVAQSMGELPPGLDDLLTSISRTHDEHVYLLSRSA